MDWIMEIVLLLPGIIIGLSFHEYAHAKVAYICGDPTPKIQGRVTINPFAHIDPIGFLSLLIARFGWGKPVMINPYNFKKPRRDELLVSLAGVTMNFLLAVIFMGLYRLLIPNLINSTMGMIIGEVISQIIIINLVLMVFNLLPIPPLDGFNIFIQIFNLKNTKFYYKVYDKGFLLLMLLILLSVIGKVSIISSAVGFIYFKLLNIFF